MNKNAVRQGRIAPHFKPTPRTREAAIYTEEQLNRRMREHRCPGTTEDLESILDSGSEGVAYLIGRELCDLIELAHLTPIEQRVCWAVLGGTGYAELGEEHRMTRYSIKLMVKRIRWKIRKAASEYPFTGLWEVYQHETQRP